MRPIFLSALALAAAYCTAQATPANPQRPNIVVFIADDLGPDGLGCYGSEFYKNDTPTIDRLADGGLRFQHCYATGICSPSRAQYATGQYPFRNGTLDIDGSGVGLKENPDRPMLNQMLRDAGYVTARTGKADICPSAADESLSGWQYWKKPDGKDPEASPARWKLVGPAPLAPENYEYFADAQSDFAVDFIRRHAPQSATKPFYLLVGFNQPHVPIQRTPDTPEGVTGGRALYADNLRYMDKIIGRVVQALRECGVLEDTLVIFTGDNGSLGRIGNEDVQSPIWDARNEKFRKINGAKADRAENREGTALVPLVIHWPRGIPAEIRGSVREELVDFTDFLPTFAELADKPIPSNWVVDGRSFAPLLRGDPNYTPREWVFHQIENNWCLRGPRYRLNRDGRFFDMEDAPFSAQELTDLTPEQATIRANYQAVLDRFDPANGPTYEGHQDCEWKNPAWDWKRKHFGTSAWLTSIAGDAADPDSDGVTNIFERAFGWDPKSGTDKMPEPERLPDGTLTITFPAREQNDVRVRAEFSEHGSTWTPITSEGDGPFTARHPGNSSSAQLRLCAERITPWEEP